ncbi:hypothetical protein [Streptomyces sp. NPDC045369]|uniref:hypothetical protein n=1 Tax=Streptomyces sp. NPDC045369 TaxID=3155732 RepID=UPI0033FF3DB6
MSDRDRDDAADWWSTTPSPAEPDSPDVDALTEAVEGMRDAAEYLRYAVTPEPPAKESNWSLAWLTNWLKYAESGKAFKRAAVTSGPVFAFVLWWYHNDTRNNGGAAAAFFMMIAAIVHWRFQRPATRTVLWGAILGPVYYPPAFLSAVVGAAQILVGGK